jgi:hypothetical protein
MIFRRLITLLFIAAALINAAAAAELAGNWTSEFDSQIGPQKYTFVFAVEGNGFTGRATFDHSMGKGESQLKDIKLEHNAVSFIETVTLDGMELVITYSGKIEADQMNLKRVVGDFATEQIVAKRGKSRPPAPPPAAK